MTSTGLILVAIAAVLSAASNIVLRLGVIRGGGFGTSERGVSADFLALAHQPLFVLGIVLYGVAGLVWFRLVSTEYLSAAYVLLVASTFVLVAAGGRVFFNEPITLQHSVGMAVILAGILISADA
jgi:multidrug transporter EmrE-like cation transporter